MHEYMQMYAYMWTWLDTAMDCMQPNLESIDFLFATNCYVTPRNDSGTTVKRQWNDGGTTVERQLGLTPMLKQQLQGNLKLFELFVKYLKQLLQSVVFQKCVCLSACVYLLLVCL